MKDLEIRSGNGGTLVVTEDTNPEAGQYVHWRTAPNTMYGVLPNTARTRQFLRRALARLERDYARRKAQIDRERRKKVYGKKK